MKKKPLYLAKECNQAEISDKLESCISQEEWHLPQTEFRHTPLQHWRLANKQRQHFCRLSHEN